MSHNSTPTTYRLITNMGLAFSFIKLGDWDLKNQGERPKNVETLADYEMRIETRGVDIQ
jgi:hypothetical protein